MKRQRQLQFPDGQKKEFNEGVTIENVAERIAISLKKKVVAGEVNGKPLHYNEPILEDGAVKLYTLQDQEGLAIMRHSAAHVLAQAVKRLYKDVKFGVGPAIEHGFYYDFELNESLTQEHLVKIEQEMRKIIKENLAFERMEVSREESERYWKEQGDFRKLELLHAIDEGSVITHYKQGDFIDLCRGPHVPSTAWIKAFKLVSVSGAYWRGDANNAMMQRIYGIAFASQAALEEHTQFLKEAAERNHKKLGSELELFMFSEEAPGMPFYLPKGQIIRNELEHYLRSLQQRGFDEVKTPLLMNQRLWEESGHWDHYHDNMYFSEVDQAKFALKPMNCPGHMLIFKNKLRSYRELPMRIAEFGHVHRHEYSGALNGLLRVRSFCQDDAHLFVTPEQIEEEIYNVLLVIDEVYRTFGFEYSIELSTRPLHSMGDDALWNEAEAALENVLKRFNLPYRINEGDGAFYGPKIDFHISDCLKRSHQCATVQLDFQMPEKFNLHYINQHNEKERPVVIHRAILGSIDRFLGILIEHYGGAFPLWLAPVQALIIPVSPKIHGAYVQELLQELTAAGLRVSSDEREEKLGYKMREAQLKKIPYVFIVGDEEQQKRGMNVRKYKEDHSSFQAVDQVIDKMLLQIQEKNA
ncbi:threonyl-tRNA ligase [Fictibacillus macauensis ZFHKF-1]|uniref:Threonine--tRNA ligase n=1 Tax=Fictibacillus macauensis ZFHKF-1 TaxID=1196324 RepID=I8AKL1_9BACL|nr:threonine--tRNA ligase [Fictibacillus macauensis]EIT86382.1 threonyl-tRNA ligase [Fictibacillus macauensis ZFHKF-1]